MICWQHDFFKNWSSAIEALATFALAGIAIFQWLAMGKNNETMAKHVRLERDRWKRDDEIHAEENRPKAAFWLEPSENNGSTELWCANVGMVNFIVSGMRVRPLEGEPKVIRFSRKDCLVVPAGTIASKKLKDPEEMFGSNRIGNAEIELIFQGPTDVKAYHLWFYNGRYMMKDPEGKFQGIQPIQCPKCNKWSANFDTGCMESIEEYEHEIAGLKKELDSSCPEHESSNSRAKIIT